MLNNIKTILWDFDGVLMDSNAVRGLGFEKVLAQYPKAQIEQLLHFHEENGGLSRYVKFRYFFEQVRGESITEDAVQQLADQFSVIMKSLLTNPALLIQDSLNFVKANYQKVPMHIVSGSDQTELRYLCQQMGIDQYFKSIHGSPTPKKELVAQLMTEHQYDKSKTVLIGDSINDLEAAEVNGLLFMGYNNPGLKSLNHTYISQFARYER